MRSAFKPMASNPHYQRGAIGLFASLVLLLTLLFTTLAVDTGRLALEKRRLQQVADLSALHAAGTAFCGGLETPDLNTVAAAAQDTASRNGYSGNLADEAGGVTLGRTQTFGGVRQFAGLGAGEIANAVRVTAVSDFPSSLVLGGLFDDTTRLQASAVASKDVFSSFKIGSGLVELDTGESALNGLLGGMLGSAVNLSLLSYKGIAATNVSLLDLVNAAAGVGTVNELLNADLSVGEFVNLLVDAVGPGSTAGVALNQLSLAGVGSLPDIKLGDLLEVSGSNPEAALDAGVNVFDLLTAGLQLANKNHAIETGLNLNLLGLANIGLGLTVIEPPKLAIGPPGKDGAGNWQTTAHTSQVDLNVKLGLNLLGLVTGNLDLHLDLAAADAHLKSVQCPTPADPTYHVTIGTKPSVATLYIGQALAHGNPVPNVVYALGIPLVKVHALLSVEPPAGYTDLEFDFPPSTSDKVETPAAGITNAIAILGENLVLQVIGLDLGGIVGSLLGALAPLLSSLVDPLLDPLLTALGIKIGIAEVWLEDVVASPTLLEI